MLFAAWMAAERPLTSRVVFSEVMVKSLRGRAVAVDEMGTPGSDGGWLEWGWNKDRRSPLRTLVHGVRGLTINM